jgi:BirA family biotin operon repressor/biotin-[acetyl-CoA-carboxylase] ligase
MQREIELIHTLADGRFHSGEELGGVLEITRAGVWKRLQQLKREFGLELDAVRGRGYRLREPLDLFDREVVLENIPASERSRVSALHLLTTLDSTNSWLMQKGGQGEPSGALCLAEYQLAGRGRHGRHWVSPFGRNVYLSLLWRFEMAPMEIAGLSLAAAIGVLRALRSLGCLEAGLKWPNDILWRGKKLAGLLLEVSGESSGPSQVVIGVGLNTWLGSAGESIEQAWTDLSSIPSIQAHSRSQLAALLATELLRVIQQYQQAGLAGFLDEWHEWDLMIGQHVEVRTASQIHSGEHLGVDASGAIRLMVDGEARLFHAGEVSLRRREVKPRISPAR